MKRTAQKDAIKDITSDSQVNSYFPYRWSPASLTINIYFYIFLYLYITRITINNGTPHLKSLKSQNRRAALGRPAIKLLGASTSLRSTNPRPVFWYTYNQVCWYICSSSAQNWSKSLSTFQFVTRVTSVHAFKTNMQNRLARWPPTWEMSVLMAAADDVFCGD